MTRIQFHLLTAILLLGSCGHQALAQSEGIPLAPPIINVWYGNNQSFGHIGNPVPAINILGNVSDPDGIASLRYTLNGGVAKSLTVGPDTRRLAKKGDFNIDIPYNTLFSGQNQVIITAVDSLNETSRDTVTVQYTSGMSWPVQYNADWSSATRISDVAQVVDGKWAIESNGLRTIGLGYDRLVGVGQTSWTNYEATVPMTILGLDSSGFQPPSNGAGIGFIIRWPGHSDLPVSLAGRQPKTGYLPLGAIGWYLWGTDMVPRLTLHGNNLALLDQDPSTQLAFNTTYMFKIRVETVAGQGGLYRMKVWQQGQPEPAAWNLSGQQGLSDPQSGSLMIMAHHVDVRLGNIVVQPVGGSAPPVISNIQHLPTSGHVSVTWGTDQQATSSVAYGLTTSYELGTVTDNSFVTQHAVALSGLAPGTLYHYRVSSTNGTGQSSSSGDLTFSTTLQSSIVSDDFNAQTLNTSIWRFINPLRDAVYTMTNTNTADAALTITVPGGTAHDPWTSGILAPRVVQEINNADFEIEFKTLTGMTLRYQQQGIVLQQGLKDFLRFEFYSDGSNTRLFAAYLINNVPTVMVNNVIAPNNRAPLFMRILRAGNQWTQRYSFDGQTWVDGVSFSHPIVLSQLGLYAANAGSPAPAITASHDYFFNTASPIVPEDGLTPVITQHPANQTVAIGQVASFSVTATGSTPLSYQWQKNGSDITGATSPSYTTPVVVQGDSGAAFRCRVTNTFGSITSNSAILNVASAPVITTHPANQTVALGSTATFSVVATGPTPISFQWQKNGLDITGATSVSYTTPATVQGDSGATFRCRVTNPFGSVTSNAAILNVVKIPTITTHPANQTVALGSTATFSVVASGTAPITYQWQKNGANIPGATLASYTTPATVQGDSGATFRCRVTNPFGNVTSNAAILNVVKIPTITTHPANQTVALGSTATFSVVASGTAPLTYQWQKNGANISGATLASYTTPATVQADNGALYRCGVSNLAGTAYSNAAILTVTSGARVATNLQVLYEFEEGAGTLVTDGSGVGTPINLTIEKPKAVQWGAGLLRIKSKTKILSTGPASKLISAAMLTNEITVEAWVNADKQKQANILTLSQGKSLNFVLGQTNKDARGSSVPGNKGSFEMELRTSTTSTKGVLFSSGDRTVSIILTHIVFTRNANGTVKFFLDGNEVASGMIPGTFGNWNSSYQLGVGGEGKEDWKGDLHLVAVYNRALTTGEVQQNFAAGPNASTPSGPDALANGGGGMPEPAWAGQPSAFALHQNYPNPFNPSTIIRYEIPEPAFVTLRVYNLLGQEVSTLVDAPQATGVFDVRFDASALTSGVYLYRLQAGHFVETRRLVLLR